MRKQKIGIKTNFERPPSTIPNTPANLVCTPNFSSSSFDPQPDIEVSPNITLTSEDVAVDIGDTQILENTCENVPDMYHVLISFGVNYDTLKQVQLSRYNWWSFDENQ